MEKGLGPNKNVKVERQDFTLNWGDQKPISHACNSESNLIRSFVLAPNLFEKEKVTCSNVGVQQHLSW